MRERLQEYAFVAEIVSALAIVLSLIFVGLQVRQSSEETAANSRALEATVRESMLNADLSILQAQLPLPHIRDHNATGTDPTDSGERAQIETYLYMMIRTRENYWIQRSNGMLDDATYSSYLGAFLTILMNSDFNLATWNASKSNLVPGFVEEIDQELSRRGRIADAE